MLVAFDSKYRLREFYFPFVGQSNHTLGHPFRFGVWVDGALSWVDDASWSRELEYESNTLISLVRLSNEKLGIALTCRDCVDFDLNLYLRKIEIVNLQQGKRDVRLFFHHDFDISGLRDGDTAFYHPAERALIHFKGQCWFLASGMTERVWGITSSATGITGSRNSEGTWRDAEDGKLGCNSITQGRVDATVSIHVEVEKSASVYYWIAAGPDLPAVAHLNEMVRSLGPETILNRVRAYWREWVSHDRAHIGLTDEIRAFYRRSLLILRTQIDNRGAILAANDSDTLDYNRDSYSYMWPRDGALVAQALDLAGYHVVSQQFFDFS